MIRAGLFAYLTAQATITAVVGTRVYPVYLPQTAELPAITFARVSSGAMHNISRSSGGAMPMFEIDCWANSYAGADTLAEIVRQKLQGFSGTMGSDTVTAVTLDDEEDAYEQPDDGSDQGVFRITLRYRIQYRESIPTP